MLVSCPECGGKVSDRAPSCIHCGLPMGPRSMLGRRLSREQTVRKRVKAQFRKWLPVTTRSPFRSAKRLPDRKTVEPQ